MHDVAQEWLRKEVKLSPDGSGQIRIFDIYKGCAQKAFTGSEVVREISDATDLYAEVRCQPRIGIFCGLLADDRRGRPLQEVPLDEAQADESHTIVPVYHYSKEPSRAHGVPFQFVLLPVRSAPAS